MWSDFRTLLTALLLVAVATLGVPVLLFGGFIGYRVGGEYLARTDFDAAAWQAARGAQTFAVEPNRIRMVDDLLERHPLVGRTRAEVTTLLGEPDYGSQSRDETSWSGWDMVYYLGPERGLIAMDSELLAIRLGADGRVSEHRIIVS